MENVVNSYTYYESNEKRFFDGKHGLSMNNTPKFKYYKMEQKDKELTDFIINSFDIPEYTNSMLDMVEVYENDVKNNSMTVIFTFDTDEDFYNDIYNFKLRNEGNGYWKITCKYVGIHKLDIDAWLEDWRLNY